MIYQDNLTVENLHSLKTLAMPPTVQATANATETLTVASPTQWVFTGTTAGQIIKLPDATTLVAGWTYHIWNMSTQTIFVRLNSAAALVTIPTGLNALLSLYQITSDGTWTVEVSNPSFTGAVAYSSSFFTSATPYIEINADWTIIADMTFRGTNIYTPTLFQIIGSRSGALGSSEVRLMDYSHVGNQICIISYTAAEKAIYYSASFTNLPAGESLFEVQARKVTGDKTRVHSVILR